MATKNNTTDMIKNNMVLVLGIGLVLGFVLGNLYTKVNILEGGGDTGARKVADKGTADPQNAGDEAPREVSVAEPDSGDDNWKGPKDARYVHIEYSDFECPFCLRYYSETLSQIEEEYGDDMAFVFRHFPLSFHPKARPAAIASECAAELGGNDAFWSMHDAIFDGMPDIEVEDFTGLAADAGINQSAFEECMDEERHGDRVDGQFSEGSSAGVGATPTSVIYDTETGETALIEGALPFASAKQIIDDFMQ